VLWRTPNLTQLFAQHLKEANNCFMFTYVTAGMLEKARLSAKGVEDMYVKEFIPEKEGEWDPKASTLDFEFRELAKVVQPAATLVLIDTSKTAHSIMQVGAALWEVNQLQIIDTSNTVHSIMQVGAAHWKANVHRCEAGVDQ
jgi:hypothetical protein